MNQPSVNITNIVVESFQRMITKLFRPFKLCKWLIFALVVFTIFFSESNFNFNFNFNFPSKSSFKIPKLQQSDTEAVSGVKDKLTYLLAGPEGTFIQRFQEVTDNQISPHTMKIIILVGMIIVTALILFIILYLIIAQWLRARMEFILLDNLVQDETLLQWRYFAKRSNSFFMNYLAVFLFVAIIELTMVVLLIIILFGWIIECMRASALIAPGADVILLGAMLLIAIIGVSIIFHFCKFIAFNILIPIMYHRDIMFNNALKVFLKLARKNFSKFMQLWLAYIVVFIIYSIITTVLLLGVFLVLFAISPLLSVFVILLFIPLMFGMAILFVPYYVLARGLGPGLLAMLDPELNIFSQTTESNDPLPG